MNDSSTVPTTGPRRYCTTICASPTMVPMAMRCRRAMAALSTAEQAVALDHARVLRIGLERRAAARDEVERPPPFVVRQRRVGVRRAHLGQQFVGDERRRRAPPSRRAARARRADAPPAGATRSRRRPARRVPRRSPAARARSSARRSRGSPRPAGGRCARRAAASRATPFGLPTCSTRSTGEKSTPRSRLEVATTQRSRPSRSASSTHSRCFRSSEPWCSASTPAQSGRSASSAWNQSSVCERVFVKTIAVSPSSIAAATCGAAACRGVPPTGSAR